MRIRTPSSIHRPRLSGGRGVALVLTTSLSVLGLSWPQLAWSRPTVVANTAPPPWLAKPSPAAVDFPLLSPRVAGVMVVGSERRSPSATRSSAVLIALSTTEAAGPDDPAENSSIDRDRRLVWFTLGSLVLAACLGGWLWLGKGKRRPQGDNVAAVPPQPPPATPVATTENHALPTSPRFTDVTAQADLPLETTTRLSPVDIVDSLVQELSSTDSAVRRHAIWELGQRGHSNAIQPLVDGLLGADSQEKSLILAALSEISSRSLKPIHRALTLGLQDPSPEVRKNAIRDLSRVYDTVVQLSHMLAHATQDPEPSVQETAQWALSQLGRIPTNPASGALSPEASTLNSNILEPPGDRVSPS